MFDFKNEQHSHYAPYVSIEKQERPPPIKTEAVKKKPKPVKARARAQDKEDKEFLRRSRLVLEYFKLELVIVLPEILEAQKIIDEKYGADPEANAKKIFKARKKLNQIVNSCKQQVLEQHTTPGFSHSSYKRLTAAIKKTPGKQFLSLYQDFKSLNKLLHRAIGKVDLNMSVAQLDMTMVEDDQSQGDDTPFRMEELESLIAVENLNISKDRYKQVVSKFYAVIRYQLYQRIQRHWQAHGKKAMLHKMLENENVDNARLIDE